MTDENDEADARQAIEPAQIRLLAAEDNATHQLVLKTLLHHVGLDLTVVENGKLLVEAWKTGEWDLILTDIGMPEMDGAAAARTIRELEAKTGRARTSIIAVTAGVLAHRVAECLEAGMDGHVGKPIAAANLYQAIEKALMEAETEAGAQDDRVAKAG